MNVSAGSFDHDDRSGGGGGGGGREMKKKRSIFSIGFKKRSTNDFSRQMTARFGCNEKDVRTIISLGFTRDQAVAALSQNNHDLLLAINGLTT